ncbi:hypothetical protein VKT23_007153 [Stygiomarasmius scandens]
MDVDSQDLSKYDEYHRGPAREVITVETKIKPTNKGFAMLAKLGWTEGTPLGLSADGRVDPIPFQMKSDSTGLGKVNQDVRMIESTVSQRRGLDSERQQKESGEQRQAREDAVARRDAVASEISDVLKAFYCSLCDKQFKNVAQYDEHTNSYAHHHKARFRDMQASVRLKPQEEVDKRKEKERKREEKELRKIAAANGIRMSKPAAATPAAPSSVSAPATLDNSGPTGFKPSGWAAVSGSGPSAAQSGFKKSGWATVGSSDPQPTQPVTNHPETSESKGSWNVVSSTTVSSDVGASGFRRGGWSTLDNASPSASEKGGWTTPSAPASEKGGWTTPSAPASATPSALDSVSSSTSGRGGWKTVDSSQDTLTTSSSHANPVQEPTRPPSKAHASRVGWQQFQKSNSRRK